MISIKTARGLIAIMGAACVLSGCAEIRDRQVKQAERNPRPDQIVIPPHIAGTVAQYAGLFGGGDMPLQGYGLVVGLGKNGSREVPPHLEKYLKKEFAKAGVGSWRKGTEAVSATRLLQDLDTAVVLVGGAIPPGAPVGSKIDLYVTALPNTQTNSLAGGVLMPADLRMAWRGAARPGGPTFAWAKAAGEVFVNPFLDVSKPGDLARARAGRIIGGGKVVRSRLIRIQLRKPAYARCDLIQRRINARFPSRRKVANAKNSSTIELSIPADYRNDYEHFLKLVMHLPLASGGAATEAHARKIATHMELPGVDHENLALVWEAMGRGILPIVRGLYTSKNNHASYYSARTGLRLGDSGAIFVLIRFAKQANSPLQLEAIHELGRHPSRLRGVPVLRELLDDENELIRVAAYEALARRGDTGKIYRIRVSGGFTLDLVDSKRGYVIYATQMKVKRIVLFGRDMSLRQEVFYNAPDDLVTISSTRGQKRLVAYRKVPASGKVSEPFRMDHYVRTLVETLGSRPERTIEGKIAGLGLTYGQVITVLSQMCKEGDIPAKFVLQQLPDVQKMFGKASSIGRPDMPDR